MSTNCVKLLLKTSIFDNHFGLLEDFNATMSNFCYVNNDALNKLRMIQKKDWEPDGL